MPLLLQKGARLLSFFVELLYFSYHVFDFLVYLQEVGIQDAFTDSNKVSAVSLASPLFADEWGRFSAFILNKYNSLSIYVLQGFQNPFWLIRQHCMVRIIFLEKYSYLWQKIYNFVHWHNKSFCFRKDFHIQILTTISREFLFWIWRIQYLCPIRWDRWRIMQIDPIISWMNSYNLQILILIRSYYKIM